MFNELFIETVTIQMPMILVILLTVLISGGILNSFLKGVLLIYKLRLKREQERLVNLVNSKANNE